MIFFLKYKIFNIFLIFLKFKGPIHHACYFDNVPIIKLIISKQKDLIESRTRGHSIQTPLLVASSAGSLEAVRCLINMGADIGFQDENGYNLIHIAAHRYLIYEKILA
jgi:ankyrin repeat protein